MDGNPPICDSIPMNEAQFSPSKRDIRRWRRYLAEERQEADTYRRLARSHSGQRREIMLALAEAEGRHEEHWLTLLGDRAFPPPKVPLGSRIMTALAGTFGSVFVLALAQRSEQRSQYDHDADVPEQMAADEHIHEEVVRSLAAESRAQMAGSFRAAVFGLNDGLISNLALILGVAAAGMTNAMVLTTGLAGLLAGALSMAAGEWISISSQKELLEASTPDVKANRSVSSLDVDANELALLFRARGESEEEAERRANEIFRAATQPGGIGESPASEASEEMPDAMGTPLQAAASSFIFFGGGALLPLIPFFFAVTGVLPIFVSAALVGAALLITGGIVGLLSGGVPWKTALRQLVVGYSAALVTYGLGTLFGVAIG